MLHKPLNKVPDVFASREASCYLAALEVLAKYDLAGTERGIVQKEYQHFYVSCNEEGLEADG